MNPKATVRRSGPRRLTEDQKRLVEEFLAKHNGTLFPLSHYMYPRMVRALMSHGHTKDDIEQLALQGVCHAASKFDPSKGFMFSTYAPHWIKSVLGHTIGAAMVARRRGKTRTVSGDFEDRAGQPLWDTEGVSVVPEQELDPEWRCHQAYAREKLKDGMRVLSPKYKRILAMRYGLEDGEDRTLLQVGCEMGLSRERIRQIEKKAIERLRDALALDRETLMGE